MLKQLKIRQTMWGWRMSKESSTVLICVIENLPYFSPVRVLVVIDRMVWGTLEVVRMCMAMVQK